MFVKMNISFYSEIVALLLFLGGHIFHILGGHIFHVTYRVDSMDHTCYCSGKLVIVTSAIQYKMYLLCFTWLKGYHYVLILYTLHFFILFSLITRTLGKPNNPEIEVKYKKVLPKKLSSLWTLIGCSGRDATGLQGL